MTAAIDARIVELTKQRDDARRVENVDLVIVLVAAINKLLEERSAASKVTA